MWNWVRQGVVGIVERAWNWTAKLRKFPSTKIASGTQQLRKNVGAIVDFGGVFLAAVGAFLGLSWLTKKDKIITNILGWAIIGGAVVGVVTLIVRNRR